MKKVRKTCLVSSKSEKDEYRFEEACQIIAEMECKLQEMEQTLTR